MIHLYYCFGGAHTSVTAANLHLGRLPPHPTYRQVLAQPYFDHLPHGSIGTFLFMGVDAAGHPVYSVGLEAGKDRLARALADFAAAFGAAPDGVALHPALPCANALMRIGGFLSRRLGLVWPGRPLVGLGAWLALPRFRALVGPVVARCRPAPPAVR